MLRVFLALFIGAVVFCADQSSSAATGRYKIGGGGTCYWDPNDSGPNQCSPAAAPQPAPAPSPNQGTTLVRGQHLAPGHFLATGSCVVANQGDGNVVWYHSGRPQWAISWQGVQLPTTSDVVLQGDGNLVVYNRGRAILSSHTYGMPVARAVFRDGGTNGCYFDLLDAGGKRLSYWFPET